MSLIESIDRLLCRMGRCRQCRQIDTDEGCGGQCILCGKVHGFVDRATLRAYCDAEAEAAERKLAIRGAKP